MDDLAKDTYGKVDEYMNARDYVHMYFRKTNFCKNIFFKSSVPIICNGLFQIILIIGTDVEKQMTLTAYGQHFRINLPYGRQKKIDYNHQKKVENKKKIWI